MGIISWIIFGLIAGILAKWIMPGKDGGGFIVTVILGIIGAVVGGWISTLFGFGKVDGFNFGSFVVAVIGAIICKKSQLKNFCDLKTAGGCGVVRFLRILKIFRDAELAVS